MKKTILKNLFVIILLIIQISFICGNFKVSKAVLSQNQTILLQGDHECNSLVEYWMDDYQKWSYKVVWYVYYIDKYTNTRYPAFCIQPEKEGIGTGYEEYNATVTKERDNVIWRILSNGYMGKSYNEWNLECDDDLYSATKIALHSYAQNTKPVNKYIVGDRSVDGNSIEEIQRRGTKVLEVAQKLYEYGINGKSIYEEPKATIKEEEHKIENINGKEYYTKKYEVSTNKEMKSYEIEINNFTSNTIILDSNNKLISNTNNCKISQKYFKIGIPIDEINKDIDGIIKINNILIKTNPIYYCNSSIQNSQNYVTYTDRYEKTNKSINMHVDKSNANIKIKKIDEETKAAIEGVTFEIRKENNEIIGTYTTDKNGEIHLKNIEPGIVKIKEIRTLNNYQLDNEEKKVNLIWGKESYIEMENRKIKGQIKIIKTSENDNEITKEKAGTPLKDVCFEIRNNEGKLVDKITTNEIGMAISKKIEKGEYIIKEIKTRENYILDEREIKVEIINNDEIIILDVTNKSKFIEKKPNEPIQKLPRTGF